MLFPYTYTYSSVGAGCKKEKFSKLKQEAWFTYTILFKAKENPEVLA